MSEKDIILNGTQIIQLKAFGVTLKDSMCYIPGSLEKFPKTFELKDRKKGYFPFTFDTKENRFYKGPWPDKKYYLPDQKKPAEREEFLKWYEDQKDKVRQQ